MRIRFACGLDSRIYGYTQLVAQDLEPYVGKIPGDYKCGFRRSQYTIDQTFSLRMVLEKSYECNVGYPSAING